MSNDTWSRVDYRRLVRWPERIERERPFLQSALAGASGTVLDLGCGTGEHARFLASQGFEVIGVDASPSMLAKATESETPPGVRFVEGDISKLGDLIGAQQAGAAICLGNTLPHLDRPSVERLFADLAGRLRRGGPFVFQIVNYERVFATNQRHLPLNFTSDEEGQVVFLRLMEPRPDGTVIFAPTTLRFDPDAEEPVRVAASRRVPLHGWQRPELERMLRAAGFGTVEAFGTMDRAPYLALESPDLIVVARTQEAPGG